MLSCDEYFLPRSLDEAFDLVERFPGEHRVVAGATDLLPWARDGRAGDVHVRALVDLSRIEGLQALERQNGRIRLGANTTFSRFLVEPLLRRHTPVMAHAAIWFADDQLRASATLAGNIVNASPAGDGIPPLVAMNGAVTLEGRRDGRRIRREVPVTEFITGPGRTVLEPGELVTAIECDDMAGWGSSFEKVGHRRSLVISTVCVAALVKPDSQGKRFEDVRIAIGAVGPLPARAIDLEQALTGQPIDMNLIRGVAGATADYVRSRSRQIYRLEVLANLVERAIVSALDEVGVVPEGADQAGEDPGLHSVGEALRRRQLSRTPAFEAVGAHP